MPFEIIGIMQQDHCATKQHTGWRIRISGVNPLEWRDVLSDGNDYWVKSYGLNVKLDGDVLESMAVEYWSNLKAGVAA